MDAHQIFWNYHAKNKRPTSNKQMDFSTLRLVFLIQNSQHIPKLQPLTAPSSLSSAPTEPPLTAPSSLSSAPTEPPPTAPSSPNLSSETKEPLPTAPSSPNLSSETKEQNTIVLCDSLFINKRWHQSQVNNLANYTNSMVCMSWVKAVASRVRGSDGSGFVALHDSDRHIHVVGGGVFKCLELLLTASAYRIEAANGALEVIPSNSVTTFSWSVNSTKAIHIQDLQLAMVQQTRNKKFVRKKLTSAALEAEWRRHPQVRGLDESPFLLLMVACSIGLPITKLFKSHEFIQRWENYRFKAVTEPNITTALLRDKFGTLEKVGIESKQLLEEYSKHIELFSPEEQSDATVDQYFWEQWYSYPSPIEIKHLLARATELKDLLFGTVTKLSI